MKVAIFDGILETHVGDSLQRAFNQRGHITMNTGKIGGGFKFPDRKSDITHLDYAVSQVLEFNPDLIFVMRPASLPFHLLNKIRSRGAVLMAWFSDDPVLFDLSYGPIVDSYDYVLHCGNATVLQFYEDWFGRPTGVNIPFWTDHDAFPRVWGSENPDTDFLFLGNVQDEVRRKRYFELAGLSGSVRIHGGIGADYFGISGGYLDSDQEVVAAASRTKIALNIPQFFENHRGLETWFSGLDTLGFFEYPSRVIQYMAMGLPTISIIPQQVGFRSYPEMIIANSIPSAGDISAELMANNRLDFLSESVSKRFEKNFSALSRVLAIESLLEDSSWRSLDSHEREVWFTQFDATQINNSRTAPLQKELIEIHPNASKETHDEVDTALEEHVVVFGLGASNPTSRFRSIAEISKASGFSVHELDAEAYDRLLVDDPAKICDSAINAARVLKILGNAEEPSTIIVCGIQAALTDDGYRRFIEAGYRVVLIDDSGTLNLKQVSRLQSRFDIYATSSRKVADNLIQRGFSNTLYLPHLINPLFEKELQSIEDPIKNVVHFYKDSLTEESVCPAIAQDLSSSSVDAEFTFDDLRKMDLKSLAKSIASEVSVVSYEGTRTSPKLNELMPYAQMASNVMFFSRNAVHELIYPYNKTAILVGEVGELKVKVEALSTSPAMQSMARSIDISFIAIMEQARDSFIKKIRSLPAPGVSSLRGVSLTRGVRYPVPVAEAHLSGTSSPNSVTITFQACSWIGDRDDWWIRIRKNGSAVYGQRLENEFKVFVPHSSSLEGIQVECEYLGPDLNISQQSAVIVSAEAKMEKIQVSGKFQKSAVMKAI